MRICEITKETFLPKTQDQFFKNEQAFEQFLTELEPERVKRRSIVWNPPQKQCKNCGETFTPEHPAQMYCDECRTREGDEASQENVKFEPIIKKCAEPGCENYFTATHWLQKKCEEHSPRGGKVYKE